jgi:hypothetical protein
VLEHVVAREVKAVVDLLEVVDANMTSDAAEDERDFADRPRK